MELRGEVDWLENNKFAQETLADIEENVDADLAKIISVEVIGSAITDANSPLKLSYYVNSSAEEEVYGFINLLGNDIPITESFANIVIIGFIAIVLLLAGVVYLVGDYYKTQYTAEYDKYSAQKADIQRQIDKAKGDTGGNVEDIISEIAKNNEATRNYFNAISVNIPQNLWLTYYYSDSTGALNIKGTTAEVANIYDFFKLIKDSNSPSDISLTKLEYNNIEALLAPEGQGDKTMSFEIGNAAYDTVEQMFAAQMSGEEGENADGTPKEKSDKNAGNNATQNNSTVKTGIQEKPTSVSDEKPVGLPEVPKYNPTN